MYEPEYKQAVKELDAAQKALEEVHKISPAERDEEHARILMVRAMRATDEHADAAATAALQELEKMAQESHSQVIQQSYHTAAGTMLLAAGNSKEAVPELQEDSDNPFALQLLWQAYTHLGNTPKAADVAGKLAGMNVATPEQALVVPHFRSQVTSEAQAH